MRKTSNLISCAAAAALRLSGCGAGNPAPAVSESGTTTSAAETTTAEVITTTATTSSEASAIADENDENPVHNKPTDIMRYTLNQLNGKSINCENRSSLHMNSTDDWKLQPGDAPQLDYDGNNPYFEFKHDSYRFTPQARFSSGAMSKECDAAFKEIVEDSSHGGSPGFGGYYDDTYKELNTVMDVDKVDEKGTIIMSKIKYGFGTQCYDKMFTVNAFVRRAKEYHIPNWVPEPEAYEIIIDPAYMSALRLPMLEYEPTKLKLSVNGTDFCGDTVRG